MHTFQYAFKYENIRGRYLKFLLSSSSSPIIIQNEIDARWIWIARAVFDSCFNLCIRCYFIYGRLLTFKILLQNTYVWVNCDISIDVLNFSFELIDKCIMTNTYLDYDKIVLVYCCIVNIYRYHTYARLLPCAIILFVFYQRKITLILSVPYNNFSPSNSLWKSAIA